jgi:hypothetical protein
LTVLSLDYTVAGVTGTAAFIVGGETPSLRLEERGDDLYFANGGERRYVAEAPDVERALELLDPVEDFNIVVSPGIGDPAVAAWCEARRHCFYVADSPLETRSSYAALYWPWLVDERGAVVPPSPAVAALYARTPVWESPVGPLAGVVDVDRGADAVAGANAIRHFSGRGVLVWGARTLAREGEWKYVAVRRLFIFLERSIDEGTRWAVHEPNDEPLWAEVRRRVGEFLYEQWRAGALQGRAPDEAYFVRCGRDTMTQDDIDNGRLVVLVGFAPLKPAEFVIVRIRQAVCPPP